MLSKLHLKNFGKHRDLKVEFTPGLNVITGANWSGKSTVLLGILYALFGAKKVPGSLGSLKTRGEAGTTEVELMLLLDDQPHWIKRSATKAQITVEGREAPLATGQNEVTTKAEELLGMDANTFVLLRTALQEQTSALLNLGPAGLEGIINKISGVSIIEHSMEQAREKEIQADGVAQGLKESIDSVDDLKTRLTEANEDLEKQDDSRIGFLMSLQASVKESEKLVEELTSLKALHDTQQAAVREHAAQSKVLGELESRREQSELALARMEKTDLDPEELAGRLLDTQGKVKKLETAQHAIAGLEGNKKTGLEAIEVLKEHLARLDEYDPRIREVKEKALSSANLALQERSTELQALKDALAGSFCHTCKRPFEEVNVEQVTADKDSVSSLIKGIRTDINRLTTDINEIAEAERVRNKVTTDLENWGSYILSAEEQIRMWNDSIRDVPCSLDDLYKEHTEVQDLCEKTQKLVSDWNAVEKQVTDLVRWEDEVRAKIPELPTDLVDESKLKKLNSTLSPMFEEQSDLRVRTGVAEEACRSAEAAIKMIESSIKTAEETQGKVDHHRKRALEFAALRNYLRKNRDRFLQTIWAGLLGYSSTFISQATAGSVTQLNRSSKGAFTYLEDGEEMPIERASGMLRAIFGTSLKLALGAAAGSGMPVLLLDEVTAAAEDSNSLLLTQLLAQTGQQVLIVTHRQADAAVAESVVQL